jgi:hypothetical protein
MEAKDRLGGAIVAMLIGMMWTAMIGIGVWLAFGWLVESFGREVAVVTVFALGGVTLAIVLWVASSRHTTTIWRSALSYAADTQELSVSALRSLSSVQREDARAHRVKEQAQAQIGVASYRAARTDARQAVRQELRIEQQPTPQPAVRSWAMAEDDAGGGDDFQWSQ